METTEGKSSARAECRKRETSTIGRCADMIPATTPYALQFGPGPVVLCGDCLLPEALLRVHDRAGERLQQRCTGPLRRGPDICCAASRFSLCLKPGQIAA